MKKGFWNKKMSDYSGSDMIKFIGVFYVIIVALYGAVYAIVFKGEEIVDFFRRVLAKIRNWFTNTYYKLYEEDSEEDGELD